MCELAGSRKAEIAENERGKERKREQHGPRMDCNESYPSTPRINTSEGTQSQ